MRASNRRNRGANTMCTSASGHTHGGQMYTHALYCPSARAQSLFDRRVWLHSDDSKLYIRDEVWQKSNETEMTPKEMLLPLLVATLKVVNQ